MPIRLEGHCDSVAPLSAALSMQQPASALRWTTDSITPSFSSRSDLTAERISGFIRLPSRTALPMSCRVGCAGIACKLPQQERRDSETGQQRNEVASDLCGAGPWRLGRADKFGGGRGPRAVDASGKGKRRGGGAYEIRHSGRCIESRRDGEPPSALPAKKKRHDRDQIHVCTGV